MMYSLSQKNRSLSPPKYISSLNTSKPKKFHVPSKIFQKRSEVFEIEKDPWIRQICARYLSMKLAKKLWIKRSKIGRTEKCPKFVQDQLIATSSIFIAVKFKNTNINYTNI